MHRYAKYLAAASLVGIATAALAYPLVSLREAIAKITQRTLNGYSFGEPEGGSAAVPTVFIFSDDKVSYSRIGFNDKRLHFPVRVTQQCEGDKWSQERVPRIEIGDRLWPSGGGKPIIRPEGAEYQVALDVLREQLDLPSALSAVQRCNQVVTDYTLQGKLPGGLLQQGFWIKVDNMATVTVTPGCDYHPSKKGLFDEPPQLAQSSSFKVPVWLRCMPTGYVVTKGVPPRPGKPVSDYDIIKNVELSAVNSPLRHTCPATVIFKGRFQAGLARKGRYRLVGSDGYASPTYPFDLAVSAIRSVSWQRRVELPNTMGSMTMGGAPVWPKPVNGWLQLEVMPDVPNAETHRSARANYRVDCLKPPSAQDRLKGG
jgi:hypothetical protein